MPKKVRGFGRIFKRGSIYWISYYHRGREYRESTKSTKESMAGALLKQRLGESGRGKLIGPQDERVTVEELLTDLDVDYRNYGRASLRTLKTHIPPLIEQFRFARAVDVTTSRLQHAVAKWQAERVANATINRRLGSLKRAFNLAKDAQPPKVKVVPKFPRLPEHNARQGFFDKAEFFRVSGNLPDDGLRDFVEWAFFRLGCGKVRLPGSPGQLSTRRLGSSGSTHGMRKAANRDASCSEDR